ncbi:hypothetical protein B5S32_g3684 [[Candida] boidinii]|nr:hypothetical protein B5S32_g3684 [[Candida] boidinii]
MSEQQAPQVAQQQPEAPVADEQQQQQQQQAPVAPVQGQGQAPVSPVAPGQEQQGQPQNTVSATDGGRELSQTILYVGGIHKSVTEDMLKELFSSIGSPIQTIKLLYDKNRPGFHYGFIEYDNNASAENALRSLNGSLLANCPLKISWAYQSQQLKAQDAFNLFIGDLSTEINDETLGKAFSGFQSLIQAHVMWDMKTGRSRGYGFVSFGELQDAERCLATMNEELLGGRPIRLNWASHKQQQNNNHNNQGGNNQGANQGANQGGNNQLHHHHHPRGVMPGMIPGQGVAPLSNGINGPQPIAPNSIPPNTGNGMNGVPPPPPNGNVVPGNNAPLPNNGKPPVMGPPQSYDMVLRQTPNWQTTVYLGNLAHFTTQNDLIPLLQNFGFIVDFKFHPEKGCAFVKYDSHERAALAIFQLSGFTINGRPLKCGWGKDRPPNMQPYQRYQMYPQKQFN